MNVEKMIVGVDDLKGIGAQVIAKGEQGSTFDLAEVQKIVNTPDLSPALYISAVSGHQALRTVLDRECRALAKSDGIDMKPVQIRFDREIVDPASGDKTTVSTKGFDLTYKKGAHVKKVAARVYVTVDMSLPPEDRKWGLAFEAGYPLEHKYRAHFADLYVQRMQTVTNSDLTTWLTKCTKFFGGFEIASPAYYVPATSKSSLQDIKARLAKILESDGATFNRYGVRYLFTPCAKDSNEAAESALFGLREEIEKFCADTANDIAESKMGKRAAENRKLEADQLVGKLGEWSKLLGVSLDDLKKSVEDTGNECTALALGDLDL